MKIAKSKYILIENVSYLFLLQGVNYLLPVITFPYLVRTLGMEMFGLLSFGMSFVQYFILITDYGFNLTATQQISICKTDIRQVSKVFCSVMLVKTLLLFICFVIFSSIVLSVHKFNIHCGLYFILYFAVAGNVVFPVWLFQGMEKMKLFAVISSAGKIIVTVLVFVFVHKPGDYLTAAVIQVIGVLVPGVIAMILVKYSFRMIYRLPSFKEIMISLKSGWYVFVSQISVTLFTNTNIFLLGIFSNNTIVGYYSIAEKIIRAVISVTVPVTTAIYPHVSELFHNSRESALSFLKKACLYGSSLYLIFSIMLFLFSSKLVLLVSGSQNETISILIKIMSILPLSVFLDNIWGTQIMLNIGMKKQFMYILIFAGVFSVVSSLLFVPKFTAFASATVFVVTELLILSMMIISVRSNKIYLLINKML